MEGKFKFLEWPVYIDSKILFSALLRVVKKLPREYQQNLGNQIVRAGFSILLNIAEGSGKSTQKDFSHYLDISLGSLYEVLASLDILKDNDLLEKSSYDELYGQIVPISKQLGGFKRKLRGY